MAKTEKKYSFFRRNGLSIVFLSLFIITLLLQAYSGWKEHSQMLEEEGAAPYAFTEYLSTGHFIQATFENWESEFIQMAMFVVLTVSLRQKGSAESKPMEGDPELEKEPTPSPDAPWPVRKGGWILAVYKHSLSITLFILFIISFVLHWYGSLKDYNEEQLLNDKPVKGAIEYLSEPKLWFETFQNWQSEFLSIAAIVILSIYLREKGSAQSKPVDMPHGENE
jgi:hypothetical protein